MRESIVIIEGMKKERIVFMGTPTFAATVLEALLQVGYDIVAVVTQPDTYTGRKKILTAPPVKVTALKYGLPVLQPEKVRKEYEEILSYAPDLIITCAYGQIIPKALLEAPAYHCINTHASLLPKYRGGAPIQRAIINGETVTRITLMYMDEKMDEGDILFQQEVTIDPSDTNTTLFEKLSHVAADMLLQHLPDIFAGKITPVPQDHSEATYAWNLKKADEFISFRESAKATSDHIRGLLDDPGAYGILNGENYKLFSPSWDEEVRGEPGTFLGLINGKIAVAAEGGTVYLAAIQAPGKKCTDAKSFYNGRGRSLIGLLFAAEQE